MMFDPFDEVCLVRDGSFIGISAKEKRPDDIRFHAVT